MNMDELETLMKIYGYAEESSPGPHSGGRTRQGLWNEQGDAAALVGAESKIDGGGDAGGFFRSRGRRREARGRK